jgi:hypothetical protein
MIRNRELLLGIGLGGTASPTNLYPTIAQIQTHEGVTTTFVQTDDASTPNY